MTPLGNRKSEAGNPLPKARTWAAQESTAAVGATWVASKAGGLNIKECLQPRNNPPR